MTETQPLKDRAANVPVPDRYALEDLIGHGGVGAVYRVRDRENGRLLALKRCLLSPAGDTPGDGRFKLYSALFEREYHTLAQLAHPRVIQVFDYGVDAHGPYYTMELLQGVDLTELAPLPWREACTIARDVASCLAILHSRRLLHRDVSPRNVNCTPDGRAKLIDFGAMTQIGVSKSIVGTPPCVPPETLLRQPLDPRSDLYALGAVLYFALTGKHAYPARRLRDLPTLWRQELAAPSRRAKEIPRALDQLVLSLLSPDPQARPLTAAEVIDRIESIAALPPGDSVAVAQAYLAAPTLVARGPTLATFRSLLKRVNENRGSVLFLEAEAGLGRTRLLDAFALEAKLAGVAVLRAGASHAASGEFGMAQAWVDDLLLALSRSAVKAAAPYAGTLGHVFPALRGRRRAPDVETFASHGERRLRVQEALLAWLQDITSRHRVVLLVDDLHRADAESAALLAGLSRRAASSRLLVVATAEAGAPFIAGEARRLIREVATLLRLTPLRPKETRQLLLSVFGQTPRLEILAEWLHGQSRGNPRMCMELASYLLGQGHVRYQGGSWILPRTPEGLEVPAALEEMLSRRLATLSADARAVAEMRALASAVASLEGEEYSALLEGEQAAIRTHAAVLELCANEVFVPGGTGYVFTQPGYVQVLEAELSEEDRRARHRGLARVYERRPIPPRLTAYHWAQAGEEARALDWLLNQPEFDPSNVVDRENAVVAAAYEAALAEAKRQRRPPREQIQLLSRLVACASQVDAELTCYADELMEHLRRDTGLDIWRSLDPAMDPIERTQTALVQAQAQYERTPAAERGLPPAEAIAALTSAVPMLASAFGRRRDPRRHRAVAALVEPLAPLSPASSFSFELLIAAARRTSGQEYQYKLSTLEQHAAKGVPGLDPGQLRHIYLTTNYYGAVDPYYISTSGWVLRVADELEKAPMFEAMAWQVRLQYHLARGNAVEISRSRKRRDLAQVQSPVTSHHTSSGIQMELVMAGRYNDLMQLKNLLGPIDAEAAAFPGWRPVAHQARGEYHFASSDWTSARREFEAALSLSAPGEFSRWPDVMARCLQTMVHQGEAEAACERGREALREAKAKHLNWLYSLSLSLAVGLADVAAGRYEAGLSQIEATRRECRERGVLDLYAGTSETLAHAALYAGDAALFEEALSELAELYAPGQHPALLAKYERLAEEGRRTFGVGDHLMPEERGARTKAISLVNSELRVAASTQERVARALELLLHETGGRGGFLFGIQDQELVFLGSHDDSPPPAEIERAVEDYVSDAGTTMEMTMSLMAGAEPDQLRWMVDGRIYHPAPLTCQWKEEQCLAGVVALETEGGNDAPVPYELLTALAEHLAKSGDTHPVSWLNW